MDRRFVYNGRKNSVSQEPVHAHPPMDSFQPPPEESGSEIGCRVPGVGPVVLPLMPWGGVATGLALRARRGGIEPGHTRSPRAGDAVCQGRLMNSHVTNHRPADKDLHLPQRHGKLPPSARSEPLYRLRQCFIRGSRSEGAPDYATESQPLGSHSGLIDEVLGEGSRSAQPMEAPAAIAGAADRLRLGRGRRSEQGRKPGSS